MFSICEICGYEGEIIEAYDLDTKHRIMVCEACLSEHDYLDESAPDEIDELEF